jgi:general secretion pathway protein E
MEAMQEQALAYLKGELGEGERNAFEESLAQSAELRAEVARSRELLQLLAAAGEEAVVQRVNRQIQSAFERGASDIHLVPGRAEGIVYLRVDGALQELERAPREMHQQVVDRWKSLVDGSLLDRRRPQEGRLRRTWQGKEFDLRVATLPTVLGERATIGIFRRPFVLPSLESLALQPPHRQALDRLIRLPRGFVAVAGPPASGKTTLLYAMLAELLTAAEARPNVMTVEDPVEVALEGLSQTAVDRQCGLTIAAALRALFRGSDPDVVMLGALPDRETTELALQVAATGHLVLAQVDANSALDALGRLVRAGADPLRLAGTLAGLVGVRLVRRVCPGCAVEEQPSPLLLKRAGLQPGDGPFRLGPGCAQCRQSGYQGRILLLEVVEASDDLRERLAEGAAPETLRAAAFGEAGGDLWDDAREQVRRGATTVEEVARAMFNYPRKTG